MSKIKSKCDVLSCIQPSGETHLGNYFGAIKNWVAMQEEQKCIFGIVDNHALTSQFDPKILRKNSDQMMIDLIACGINPQKAILFVQSLVPEHIELSWILGTVTSYGELTRQVQFKEKKKTKKDVSAGLFTYPVLQAADILIYRVKEVPIGKDQTQNLELTRNIAEKFNNRYGEYFPLPKPMYSDTPKIMSLADPTRKMSKIAGENHFIRLFEEEKTLRKKVMSAVTDSGDTPEGEMSPGVKNLFELLKACEKETEILSLLNDFNSGTLKYKLLKETVADSLVELTSEMRRRRTEIEKDVSLLNDSIREMSGQARAIAKETLYEVKQMVGLKSRSHF